MTSQDPGVWPGVWEVTRQPDYQQPGLRRQCCAICGAILKEEEIPGKVPVSEILLSDTFLDLYYRDSCKLTAELKPEHPENSQVVWSSSDESVAVVDQQGVVTAAGRGKATITCTSQDGFASGSCGVSVGMRLRQWLIWIFLFGWLWY